MLWTNRGKYLILNWAFRAVTLPTHLYIALLTSDTEPTVDINTLSELTEIATGNGYVEGGYELTPGTTDFDVITENDVDDLAFVQVKDISWAASGGSIPDSGNGARYAALLSYNATPANREVIAVWDLVTDRVATDGHSLSLVDCELKAIEPS